jgi:hypothetical protein
VVGDAVERGNSHGGIGEGVVPFAERLIPGQDQAFITFPGSVRCWRPLWSRVLLTPGPSDQDVFSAWIGLVPKQHSSGGKDRLGSISKQGDRYLRSLFVAGALAVIRYAKIHGTKHRPWLTALLARRPVPDAHGGQSVS